MKFISSAQAAASWNISKRRVAQLASQGRIEGAEFTGYTWLIPENAQKPADIRKAGSKTSPERKAHDIFPYPVYILHSDEQLEQFSAEEKELYRSCVLYEAGKYAESQKCAEALLRSENRNIRLGALDNLVFICLYRFDYEAADRYSVMFLAEYHASEEHSPEYKLLHHLYELEIGKTSSFLEAVDFSDILSFPKDLYPCIAATKMYSEIIRFGKGGPMPDICAYELICHNIDSQGYYLSSMMLNGYLSFLYGSMGNFEYERLHIKRALDLAVEHDIVTTLSPMMYSSPEQLESVLSEYPESFSQRLHTVFNCLIKSRAGYIDYQNKKNSFFSLSVEDYKLISYCLRHFTNEQIAELFGLSRSGMNKRLANLYQKLGVESKKELLEKYLSFYCDWNK